MTIKYMPIKNIKNNREGFNKSFNRDNNRENNRDTNRENNDTKKNGYAPKSLREKRRFINKRNENLKDRYVEYDKSYSTKTERIDGLNEIIRDLNIMTESVYKTNDIKMKDEMIRKWNKLLDMTNTSQSASDVLSVYLNLIKHIVPTLTQVHIFLNALRRLPVVVKKNDLLENNSQVRQIRSVINLLDDNSNILPSTMTLFRILQIIKAHSLPTEFIIEVREAFFDKWAIKTTVSQFEYISEIWLLECIRANRNKDLEKLEKSINGLRSCLDECELIYGLFSVSKVLKSNWLHASILTDDFAFVFDELEKYYLIHKDMLVQIQKTKDQEAIKKSKKLESKNEESSDATVDAVTEVEDVSQVDVKTSSLLDEYVSDTFVDERVFISLLESITIISENSDVDWKIIELMESYKMTPTIWIYNKMLELYQKNSISIKSIWSKLISKGLVPDENSLSFYSVSYPENSFTLASTYSILPTPEMYVSLLNGKDLDFKVDLWEKVKKEFLIMAPFLYTSFFLQPLDLKFANELLLYGSNKRVRLTSKMISQITTGLSSSKISDKPVEFFANRILVDYSIPASNLSVLLSSLLDLKEIDAALLVLDRIEFKHKNDPTYKISRELTIKLINYLMKNNFDMVGLLEKILSPNSCFNYKYADVLYYFAIHSSLSKDLNMCNKLFTLLDITSDPALCSSLLEVYLHHNKIDEFKTVIDKMKSYNLYVLNKNIGYYINSSNLNDELKAMLNDVTKDKVLNEKLEDVKKL